MLVTNIPKPSEIRIIWNTLKHQRRCPVGKRTIENVTVPCDPANIRGTPVNITIMIIKNVLVGDRSINQISSGGMKHSLRFTGRTGCVEDEQRILCIQCLGRAFRRSMFHCIKKPNITTFLHLDWISGSFQHQACFNRGPLHRGISISLERDTFLAPKTCVRSDHHFSPTVLDPTFQGFSTKTSENHGMNRAYPGAGQTGHSQFRDHRHIDHHPVTLFNSLLLKEIGKAADLLMKFPVGKTSVFFGIISFPDQGNLISLFLKVTIQAVVADIQLSTLKPADVRLMIIPVQHLVPFFKPVDPLRLFSPEGFGIFQGLAIHLLIFFIIRPGGTLKILWYFK